MDIKESTPHLKIPVFLVSSFVGLLLFGLIFLLITFYLGARRTGNNLETNTKILTLSISSPRENLAVSQKEIQLVGQTGKDSVVTVSTDSETKTLETKNALFSTKLSLREGLNIIQVVAFDLQTGESQTTNRQILYLENELTNL